MEIHWNPCPDSSRHLLISIGEEVWKRVDKRLFTPYLYFLKKAKTPNDLQEIFEKIEKKIAIAESFRILSVRSFFSLEMKQKLEKKCLSEKAIQEALEKCKEIGALNDNEQAARFIESQKRKGRGPYLIALKLRAKQGKPVAHDLVTQEEQIAQIVKLLSTRYKKWKDSLQDKQKAYMALKRRGFSSESILAAMGNQTDLWQ